MKDLQWFPPIPVLPETSTRSAAWPIVGAATCGLLFAWRGHLIPAIVVWTVALLFGLAFLSSTLRLRILAAMRWFSNIIGRIATVCVLWPFYVVVFGAIHLVLALDTWDMEVIAPGCEAS